MRRALLFAIPVLALALTGCPTKPKDGTCKSSEDCAEQEGFGKVCVEGRCQECGQDTDCKAGFVCRQNKCVPRPECEKESDCPAGKTCKQVPGASGCDCVKVPLPCTHSLAPACQATCIVTLVTPTGVTPRR